jgi:hypothetical protein
MVSVLVSAVPSVPEASIMPVALEASIMLEAPSAMAVPILLSALEAGGIVYEAFILEAPFGDRGKA